MAVPELTDIALVHYGEKRQRACEQLLMLKEVERVSPILSGMAQSKDPAAKHNAYEALALLKQSEPEHRAPQKRTLSIDNYQTALGGFCRVGLSTLDSFNGATESERAAVLLAEAGLYWLLQKHGQLNDVDFAKLSQVQEELHANTVPIAVIGGTRFAIQPHHVEKVQERLFGLWRIDHETLSVPLRQQLVTKIARAYDRRALEVLGEALDDEDSSVRGSAAWVLGRVGNESVGPRLTEALDDRNSLVRGMAAYALGELGASNAVKHIAGKAPASSIEARYYAHALSHLSPRQAIAFISECLQDYQYDSWLIQLEGQALWYCDEHEQALQRLTDATKKEKLAGHLLARGHLFFERGELLIAQGQFDQALSKNRRHAEALLSQAIVYWKQEQKKKALATLDQALRSDRRVIDRRHLEYDRFWRVAALNALDEILAAAE